ncbi:MAG TPA: DUF5615 family PIN-like protein [Tepidisphaeraceae bacterium]|jgi:predicted nuclease of predicted toxin-antitoxin system|nr:DUF5615 family PIN-like protein [Tepidisphaeraceae bacterium]
MGVKIYMDEQVPSAITRGLRSRGVDVRTVQDESREGHDDEAVLDHSDKLERVLFTRDDDFLRIAAERQAKGIFFRGIVYGHQQRASIGQCVDDLELIAIAGSSEEFENRVYHLPIKQ